MAQPLRSPTLAGVFYALAIATLIGGVALVVTVLEHGSGGGVVLTLTAAAGLAHLLWRQGVRASAPPAESVLGPRTRPIVYLRPFDRDDARSGAYERWFAELLAPLGPMVAVGRPGERLQGYGVPRAYPEDWRATVADLLDRAALVVLRPGPSEGIRWELEQVVQRVPPARLLLDLWDLRNDGQQGYDALADALAPVLPEPLPPWPGGAGCMGGMAHALLAEQDEVAGTPRFVAFADDWTPRVLGAGPRPMTHTLRVLLGTRSRRLVVGAALQQPLARLGLALPRPRVTVDEALKFVLYLCLLLGVGALLWITLGPVLTLLGGAFVVAFAARAAQDRRDLLEHAPPSRGSTPGGDDAPR